LCRREYRYGGATDPGRRDRPFLIAPLGEKEQGAKGIVALRQTRS